MEASDYWYLKKDDGEPKDIAKQIYDAFDGPISINIVEKHAFKCIDLIIEAVKYDDGKHFYWLDVKSELINLRGNYNDNKK